MTYHGGIRMEKYSILSDAIEEIKLIQRHLKILNLLKKEGPIGIMKISQILNMPPHRVRYSLRILELEGMIGATPDGAQIIGNIDDFKKLLEEGIKDLEKELENVKKELNSS